VHLVVIKPLMFVVATQIVNSLCGSVVIVELVRTALPSMRSWADRKHFATVALVWPILFSLQMYGAVVFRQFATR